VSPGYPAHKIIAACADPLASILCLDILAGSLDLQEVESSRFGISQEAAGVAGVCQDMG
jgi:hypothetical protein